jgi:hypothetical protein
VPFDYGTLAEVVIVKRQAGVIDEDIERLDCLDSCLNLRRVGHVQGQGRDTPIPVGQGLARTRVHPLAASPHGPLDQRLPDAAIGASNQNCSGCDLHAFSSWLRAVRGRRKSGSDVPVLDGFRARPVGTSVWNTIPSSSRLLLPLTNPDAA